jgi:hypothetical protein
MAARPLLIALFAATLAAPAAAQTTANPQQKPAPIQQRLQTQAARIRAGVQAGSITPAERARLVRGELAVRRHLQAIRQSGRTVTPAERRQMNRTLNRLSFAIARAVHG